MNMSSMEEKIKKVGEIWVTSQTLSAYFPHDCVVNCKPIEMKLNKNFPVLLKKSKGIKYEIYAKDREDYNVILDRNKNSNAKKENEDETDY